MYDGQVEVHNGPEWMGGLLMLSPYGTQDTNPVWYCGPGLLSFLEQISAASSSRPSRPPPPTP